jgi:hypothetical protein
MFSFAVDRAHGNCIWLFSGETNSDDDFARYIETFALVDSVALQHELPAGILVVDRENPMPNALWRKRIAEASGSLKSRPLLAFASESPLVRGVLTAINWLRPPPFEFAVTSTFDDAVHWVEQKRQFPCKVFFPMMAEVRAMADAASAPASRTGKR